MAATTGKSKNDRKEDGEKAAEEVIALLTSTAGSLQRSSSLGRCTSRYTDGTQQQLLRMTCDEGG